MGKGVKSHRGLQISTAIKRQVNSLTFYKEKKGWNIYSLLVYIGKCTAGIYMEADKGQMDEKRREKRLSLLEILRTFCFFFENSFPDEGKKCFKMEQEINLNRRQMICSFIN